MRHRFSSARHPFQKPGRKAFHDGRRRVRPLTGQRHEPPARAASPREGLRRIFRSNAGLRPPPRKRRCPHSRDVQIQLKNPLLVQREFQTPCHDGFLELPQDRTLRRKPQVLGKLLRDGAAPGGHPAFIPVTLQRIVHLGKIESVVLPEQIVFGRHHGDGGAPGNALERNPACCRIRMALPSFALGARSAIAPDGRIPQKTWSAAVPSPASRREATPDIFRYPA